MFKIFSAIKDLRLPKPLILLLPTTTGFWPTSLDFSATLINDLKYEYIFGNISFIVLFIAVLLYWVDFSNTLHQYKVLQKLKNFCMIGANLSLTTLLAIRWWQSGHFPLSNLYESLIGLSWGFTVVHLIITRNGTILIGNDTTVPSQALNDKIGTITAPTALLTSVFATFFLPPDMLRATTLIPALKSNWLTMHVSLMVASYAFLLVGSLLSISYCVYWFSTQKSYKDKDQESFFFDVLVDKRKHQEYAPEKAFTVGKKKPSFALEATNTFNNNSAPDQQIMNQTEIGSWLDTTSYRILGLGFPLLTIGILSGAVWANEAWGSYWSWDPKETWALITWLVFAVYFHSRYNRLSEVSVLPACIASIGFVVIWVCYLGVNLLGSGLHSYGWF